MFTKKLLRTLNSLFFRATNIPLSLSYSDGDKIIYLLPTKSLSRVCKFIQSVQEGKKKCFENDSKAIETAIKTKQAEIYRCHAGLMNIVLPILVNNENVGAIFAGPLLMNKMQIKDIKKYINGLKELNIDTRILEKIYENMSDVKICSRNHIKFAIKMLSLLAHFIVYKEIAKKFKGKIEPTFELQKKIKILQNKLVRAYPYLKIETKKEENLSANQKAVKRAKEYIDNNLNKNIPLKDVATVAALSPTYFSWVFKKETKTNFEDYFIQARIEKAKKLLKDTFYSIGEITDSIGYSDQNYFSFLFKKVTGFSPRDYRNLNK